MITEINNKIDNLVNHNGAAANVLLEAKSIYGEGFCQVLSRSKNGIDVLVQTEEEEDSQEISFKLVDGDVICLIDNKPSAWNAAAIAALLQAQEEMKLPGITAEGKAYTRQGMIKRVLAERKEKAAKTLYKIKFANNIFGEHELINEKGTRYFVLLRDFTNETGYINNPDWQTNKLGTSKHIMYAFDRLKNDNKLYNKLSKTFPYVEIYTDPLNDYNITWFYPHNIPARAERLIKKYFGDKKYIPTEQGKDFLQFIQAAAVIPEIVIRAEVEEKVKQAWDNETLKQQKQTAVLDFNLLKVPLFPYQQQGVNFATFKQGCIIADEMGLGKTIQAIGAAVMKKKIFGFRRTLIVCPASLKEQWKKEIEKFSYEEAVIVDGLPKERNTIYRKSQAYFLIINYETVLRDLHAINKMEPDFIILDEAQKIKNFTTITAHNIKQLNKKHALVITGTPIENRISDLYSIVQFVDQKFLAPLWEFSYQHCFFDEKNRNKITGYYNLQNLYERLKPILLRREKKTVIKELPTITQINVPINLHEEQQSLHAGFAKTIASILRKKFITPYDQQKLMLTLLNMRMVCDSTFLVDKETHISPKLVELKEILVEKMDLQNNPGKIIIFSEWVVMLQLIGKMLHELGIGFAMLSGKVQVRNRGKLVKKFETDPDCKIFLSSEAGGVGLNLQVADTIINFELPWNPAKKNQRLGRIDRLGQRSKKLTVISFISRNSIEGKIAEGLGLKQNLFDGVLSENNRLDVVDFSASGRAQFLEELELAMSEMLVPQPMEDSLTEEIPQQIIEEDITTIITEEEPEEVPVILINNEAETAVPSQMLQMEQVMQHGMNFLSGLYQMATGKTMAPEDQKINIDQETGEVVMRFKMKW
ncbi:MAG: DEAD/DEAH box helicase [Chitinophagaceae bacterium]